MAKIVDPTDISQTTDVIFDTIAKTIQILVSGAITGIDGVTLQCVYSFCKEEWKTDNELIKFPFPLIAITAEQFELFNGWNWADELTKQYLRDGGWAVKNASGNSTEEYMNLTTLGSFNENTDTSYYLQDTTVSSTVYSAEVNQAIQIYDSVESIDYRNNFKIYLREQAKVYDIYDLLTEQNLTELTYKKYALPLSNSIDLKITHTDIEIETLTPYTNMSITYYDTVQSRTIGSSTYDFKIIIDGANGSAEEIYEYIQYQLRNDNDIDSGLDTVTGKIAEELVLFIGDTLRTTGPEGYGVFIDNFLAIDTNRLVFTESTGSLVFYPYVAAGSLQFNDNLANDGDALYWIFFTDANGNKFDSTDALIINNKSGQPLSGVVGSNTSIEFDYDYDGNTQGGRVGGEDAPYTAVAIGLESGQYVKTVGVLQRSTSNVINFVAALERNYSNPI